MKKYENFLLEKRKERNTSGILFIYDSKVLLVYQTDNRWSYPKGGIDKGETKREAAIRETEEEVGVILPSDIIMKSKKNVAFTNKEGKKYFYFSYELNAEEFEKYFDSSDIIPKSKLQAKEIIEAKFVPFEKAKKILDKRFKNIIDKLIN